VDIFNPAENPAGFTVMILVFTGVVVALSLVWRRKFTSGLLDGGMPDGIPTTAVILGMGQTGLTINEQPQLTFTLQVQPPTGGAPYQVEIRQTVPMIALGMLAPGRTIAVRVSPTDPMKVRFDLQSTSNLAAVANAMPAMQAGMQPGMPGMGAPAGVRSNDELVASGTPVAADVVSVQDTGQMYGTDPICLLTMKVHAPTGAYDVQVAHRVPADRRARLVAGLRLRAAVDPVDRNALGIDWRTV
jgi:hypothetical protein